MTPVIIQTQMGTTFVNHTHKVYLLQNRKSRPSYLLYYQNSHSTNVEGNMIIWLVKSTKINRKQQKVTKNVMIMQFKPSNKYALVQFLMTTTSGYEIFVLSLWQIYVLSRIFKFNQGLTILMRNRYTLNSFIHVHESTYTVSTPNKGQLIFSNSQIREIWEFHYLPFLLSDAK